MRDISYVEHTVGTSEVVPSGGPLFSYKVAKVGPQLKSISLQHFLKFSMMFISLLYEKKGDPLLRTNSLLPIMKRWE